jgi:hypothetical protein
MIGQTKRATWIAALCGACLGTAALCAAASDFWARQLGGPGRERAAGVAADRGGVVYVAGRIEGEAVLGSVRLAVTSPDALVTALDRYGEVVWAHAFGGPGEDEARAVAILMEGDVFVTGSFSGTVDFDPGPGRTELVSGGATDVFVLRLSPRGELVWARGLGGAQADDGLDIAVDARGVYVAGSFQGSLQAGPVRLESAGRTDGFVLALDPAGAPRWARRIGGPESDAARSVALEPNSLWIAGSFEGKAGFGPQGEAAVLESAGKADAFVARLGPDGALLWSGRLGGKQTDVAQAVAANVSGAWVTGRFQRTADFDPGPTATSLSSTAETDAFVVRLSTTGHLRWVRQVGGEQSDFATGIAPDRYGGVWVTGVSDAKTSAAGPDPEWKHDRAWLTLFDRDGERRSTRDMAAQGGIRTLDITLDSAANPCVAGVFQGQATIETGAEIARLTGAGKTDALVSRILP